MPRQLEDLTDIERANVERTTRLFRACSTGPLMGYRLPNMEFAHLSVRTQNCLANEGIKTEAQLLDYWDAFGDEGFLKVPNFGRKSLNELKASYGLPSPAKSKRRLKPVTQQEYERAKRIVERYEAQ